MQPYMCSNCRIKGMCSATEMLLIATPARSHLNPCSTNSILQYASQSKSVLQVFCCDGETSRFTVTENQCQAITMRAVTVSILCLGALLAVALAPAPRKVTHAPVADVKVQDPAAAVQQLSEFLKFRTVCADAPNHVSAEGREAFKGATEVTLPMTCWHSSAIMPCPIS